VMYGKHEQKLALARSAGITTKRVRGEVQDAQRIRTRYGLVVEATGSPTGLMLAQELTEPRGTLVLKSTFHGVAAVETWPIVVKEITVVGSRCGPFAKSIGLLGSGKIDPRPLITEVLPMAEAPRAMELAQKRGVMKVILRAG
jgi:threonine dehydrogenase-like Zn-dependent dehydrogenase